MINPRELAISVLVKTQEGSYSNLLLNRLLSQDMLLKDRALTMELVNGVIKNKLRLDYIISQFSKIKLSKISPVVINAIRIGIYQVFFLDRVPDFAAVNETVNIVKKYEGKRAANFTNAILRNVLRNKNKIYYPNRISNIEDFLSIYYSFPRWLISRWNVLFGTDFTEKLCKAFNKRKKTCIRINTLVTTTRELEEMLLDEGVVTQPGRFVKEAVYFVNSISINQLESFRKGLFTPQDESSILVSRALGVENGDLVLDAAAAPGGKTTHMAALMNNKGKIIAWDIHPHRVKLIEQNCKRLKVSIVETCVKDALVPDASIFKFDKV